MELNELLVGIGTFLLPLLLALFKREIASLYQSWAIYHSRPFDQDRNPNTPDRCQLYNPSTGLWENILIEKYEFSLNQDKRGVFICHPVAEDEKTWARERIPFDVWASMRKRTMPETEEKRPFEVNLPVLKLKE
ncbi:MAG: hypothetical protein AAGH78_06560 [Cyanobacteria bacterium P01_H01_bin.58]